MKINKELVKGSTTTLILQTLSEKEMYGYEITKKIKDTSNSVFSLNEGTLYPILHKLEADGYVISFWETVNGRKRKYYKITNTGESLLRDKKKEWNLFKNAVDSSLLGGKVFEE